MVPVPTNAKKVTDNLVVFIHEFKDKPYISVRKTYLDKESGEPAIGKGLTVTVEDWQQIVAMVEGVSDE